MDPQPILADPERQLALAYAPAARREALRTLWALDEQFAHLAVVGKEPTLALMRLTWWRDALTALDERPAPAQPLLQAVAAALLPLGVRGEALASMEEGWSALIDAGSTTGDWEAHAELRGAGLFRLSAAVLGAEAGGVEAAGRGWALAERAGAAPDPAQRSRLLAAAAEHLVPLRGHRWPRMLRPLGVLAVLAAADARAGVIQPRGGPRRVLRALRMGLTGR